MKALSLILLVIITASATGCGTYRTTYIVRQGEPREGETIKLKYAHGIGLIGGGGYFFAIHRMLPAWISWSGPIDLSEAAPEGYYKVEQYNSFGQNTFAAFLSWLVLVNAYHSTHVIVTPGDLPR